MREIERALEWLNSPVNVEFRKNHQFWTANVIRDVARLLASYAASEWVDVPNEQGWWWHSHNDGESAPFVYQVLASLTGGNPRYFIAFPDSRWCDEVGGLWQKIKVPQAPTEEAER